MALRGEGGLRSGEKATGFHNLASLALPANAHPCKRCAMCIRLSSCWCPAWHCRLMGYVVVNLVHSTCAGQVDLKANTFPERPHSHTRVSPGSHLQINTRSVNPASSQRVSQSHPRIIPESHQSHTRVTPESHQSHTRVTPESHLSHTSVTPESH